MKRLTPALLFLLMLTPFAAAKDSKEIAAQIATLVNEKTFLVAHADLNDIDFGKLENRAVEIFEFLMKEFKFDNDSMKSCVAEAKKIFNEKRELYREPFEKFKSDTGVSDIYFTGTLSCDQVPIMLAIPAQGKTEDQKKAIIESFEKLRIATESPDHSMVVTEFREFILFGFLDIGAELHEEIVNAENLEKADEIFSTYLNNKLVASKLPILQETLALCESDPIKIALFVPKNIVQVMQKIFDEKSVLFPEEQRGTFLYAQMKFKSGIIGVNPYRPEVNVVVKATSRLAARDIVTMMETVIEYAKGTVMTPDRDERSADLVPLVKELYGGYLRSFLPKQENDLLSWKFNLAPETFSFSSNPLVTSSGIAIGMLIPGIQTSREAARRFKCTNQERHILIAFHNYHEANKTFPPLYTIGEDRTPLHSWRVLILPLVEESELYNQIRLDEPWDSEYNKQFHNQMPSIYACPNSPTKNDSLERCCYSVIMGDETAFIDEEGKKISSITDGASNTICIVERRTPVNWMDPLSDITFEEASEGIWSKNEP
ncbi:MAG: DUF1559 domain-containing protein [Thermoguttaceae bacterium]